MRRTESSGALAPFGKRRVTTTSSAMTLSFSEFDATFSIILLRQDWSKIGETGRGVGSVQLYDRLPACRRLRRDRTRQASSLSYTNSRFSSLSSIAAATPFPPDAVSLNESIRAFPNY